MDALPMSVEELVEQLDVEFPSRPPALSDTDREVWFNAGTRFLVEHLKARLEYTKKTSMSAQLTAVDNRIHFGDPRNRSLSPSQKQNRRR